MIMVHNSTPVSSHSFRFYLLFMPCRALRTRHVASRAIVVAALGPFLYFFRGRRFRKFSAHRMVEALTSEVSHDATFVSVVSAEKCSSF